MEHLCCSFEPQQFPLVLINKCWPHRWTRLCLIVILFSVERIICLESKVFQLCYSHWYIKYISIKDISIKYFVITKNPPKPLQCNDPIVNYYPDSIVKVQYKFMCMRYSLHHFENNPFFSESQFKCLILCPLWCRSFSRKKGYQENTG